MRLPRLLSASLFLVPMSARAFGPSTHVPSVSDRSAQVDDLMTDAVRALRDGNAKGALEQGDQAAAIDGRDPWVHYNRAIALFDLGHLEEGLAELSVAEHRFVVEKDDWGRSRVLYQRGLRLRDAGRCNEAAAAMRAFATLVPDPDDRAQADRAVAACIPPSGQPVATERRRQGRPAPAHGHGRSGLTLRPAPSHGCSGADDCDKADPR
jgi:hypothetical protein